MSVAVAEISIVRPRSHLVYEPGTSCADPAIEPLPVHEVIRDLRQGIDAGARSVLLTVDANGGAWSAAFALFGALRDVSDSGRPVVAFVSRYAASVASWFILVEQQQDPGAKRLDAAADFDLSDPGSVQAI